MSAFMGSQWKVAAASAQGRRSRNEDRVLAKIIPGREDAAVIAVADGMGGHEAGNVAAELAIRGFWKGLRRLDPKHAMDAIWHRAIYADINRRVFRTAGRIDKGGMGTTLVSVLVSRSGIFISHIGDSRAYRIDPYCVARLTEDHSVAEDAIRRGIVDGSEAEDYGFGHALLKAIGTDESVEPDFATEKNPANDEDGRVYLACSDGLWNVLSDGEIEKIVRRTSTVEEAANALVGAALAAGSDDNVSVALLEIGKLPRSPVPLHLPPEMHPGATIRYRKPARESLARRKRFALILAGIVLAVVIGMKLLGTPRSTATSEGSAIDAATGEYSGALDSDPLPEPPRVVWLAVEGEPARIIYRGEQVGTVSPGSLVDISVFPGDTVVLISIRAEGRVERSVVIGDQSPDTIRIDLTSGGARGGGDG